MHGRTFKAKIGGLLWQTCTVWNGDSPYFGLAGKIVGRDLARGTLKVRFPDGVERDELYRNVPLGDNSRDRYPLESDKEA